METVHFAWLVLCVVPLSVTAPFGHGLERDGRRTGWGKRTRQIPFDVLPRLASQLVDLGLLVVSLVLRLVERAEPDVGVALVRHVDQWLRLNYDSNGEIGAGKKRGNGVLLDVACLLKVMSLCRGG